VNHKPTMTFSKGHQVAPNVGFRVAGSSDEQSPDAGGSPSIYAAEGSTVIYAAPGAVVGYSPLGSKISELVSSEMFWIGAVLMGGLWLMTRGSRS